METGMSEPTLISSAIPALYLTKQSMNWKESIQNMQPIKPIMNEKRQRPPLVKPKEMPRETMCRILETEIDIVEYHPDYITIRDLLSAYHKQRDDRSWDEYRRKIKQEDILVTIEKILTECERHGFINPTVNWKGKIVWQQILANGDYYNLDRCTLCHRPCERREEIETGEAKWRRQRSKAYKEPRTCWESSHAES